MSDKVPRWANIIYTHYSDPLSSIIIEYNKNSVNIIGENIMKTLGAQYKGMPGTWDKGSVVISEFLNEVGIKNGFKIVLKMGASTFFNRAKKVDHLFRLKLRVRCLYHHLN